MTLYTLQINKRHIPLQHMILCCHFVLQCGSGKIHSEERYAQYIADGFPCRDRNQLTETGMSCSEHPKYTIILLCRWMLNRIQQGVIKHYHAKTAKKAPYVFQLFYPTSHSCSPGDYWKNAPLRQSLHFPLAAIHPVLETTSREESIKHAAYSKDSLPSKVIFSSKLSNSSQQVGNYPFLQSTTNEAHSQAQARHPCPLNQNETRTRYSSLRELTFSNKQNLSPFSQYFMDPINIYDMVLHYSPWDKQWYSLDPGPNLTNQCFSKGHYLKLSSSIFITYKST